MQIYFLLWNALKRRSDGIYNLHIQHLGENDKISRVVASSLVVHSRERGSSSDNVVCFVMLNQGGRRYSKIWEEKERGSRYMGQHRNIIHMMMGGGGGGGGGGGVVCPLSSAGHRSHCMDTVQSPMGWPDGRRSVGFKDWLTLSSPLSLHCVLTTC